MPQFLLSNQSDPYLNIAVENYLLSLPSNGQVTLYLWSNRRTVVIGQYQNPYSECNVEQLESDGGFLMRRRTGGGAVYHDLGNLNFSFVVPYELYDQSRQLSVLQKAVAAFGLQTEVSGRNDVLCQGRKFSGNAFSKGRNQRLHHGTILIRTDVEAIQKYLKVKPAKLHKHGVDSHQSRVVNLSELNPAITAVSIVPHLLSAFEQEYGTPVRTLDFHQLASLPEVQQLRLSFASPEWKYGRWQQFEAQRSAQFDWGGVEISLQVDEPSATITSINIASDCLLPDAIDLAQSLLRGASTQQLPTLPAALDSASATILSDIFSLLY
jgi:lipoate-protein ligase A